MMVYIVFIIGDGICANIKTNEALRRNWWGLAAVVIHMISILPILILRALENVACNKGWDAVICIVKNDLDAVFAFFLISINIFCWYKVIVNTPVSFANNPADKYKNL